MADSGRLLVRLNCKYHHGLKRYGIGRITNNANGKSLLVLVLGHDAQDSIFMPYDIRMALDVAKTDELDFTIRKAGFLGRLCWYVNSPDPAVSIPAWIAIIGLIFGVVALILGIVPLIGLWKCVS